MPRQPDDVVSVVIERLTPHAPRPGQRLRVTGRVVNLTEETVRDVTVRLQTNQVPMGSRSQLAEAAAQDVTESPAGFPVDGSEVTVADQLQEGASGTFSIRVPTNSLGFGDFGVYPIALEAQGTTEDGTLPLGTVTTFLPWTPAGAMVQPTKLALLWPLVDVPRRDANGVFPDDTFAADLVAGGRLQTLLSAADDTTVTWAVDPELLETVRDMADGYRVRSGDRTVPGGGAADAERWLTAVRAALTFDDVISLPYADPDLTAIHRQGLDQDLTLATTTGPATAEEVLGRAVTEDVVWPPDGRVNQSTLEALRVAGAQSILLAEEARPLREDLTYTPSGRARVSTIGGSLEAALADRTLSDLIAAPTEEPGAGLLARQRFLAETAMITAESPSSSRSVLAIPPRRWNPDPDYATALLASLRAVPWVQLVTVQAMLDSPVADAPRRPLTYRAGARADELQARYLDDVRAMRRDLERFASILAPRGGTATAPFDLAILRTESSAWRDSPMAGNELRDRVRTDLDDRRSSVFIAADRLVTLTSKSGRFPITIANDLDEPVDIGIELRSRQPTRLTVGEPRLKRIGPRRKTTIEIPAEARANGLVTVDAQLRTPDGQPYGRPVAIGVRATDYGTIAYVITGGAVVVLFAAAGFRISRRAVAARRSSRHRRTATVPPEESR